MRNTSGRDEQHLKPRSENRFSLIRRVRYRLGETRLRAPFVWLKHRGLRSADVFVGAYPRSGYTWLIFLIYEIVTGESAQFETHQASYVGEHADAAPLFPSAGRLITTHETYRDEYKRAIYVVRDIRDVAVSEFLREKAKGLVETFDDYLPAFLEGQKRHGSWPDHVSSWLDSAAAAKGNLCLYRYEDLRSNTEETLRRILDFLRVEADPLRIRRAIAENTIERMREKEDVARAISRKLVRRPFKGSGDDGRFVRKGMVGGWRDYLNKAQLRKIEDHAGKTLLRLEYPLFRGLSRST